MTRTAPKTAAGGSDTRLRKILLLITTSDVGGTESFLANLALGLNRSRFSPVVCSLCPPGKIGQRLIEAGIEVVTLGMAADARPWQMLSGVVRLARLLDRLEIDLVQALLYRANMLAALAGRLARRPVVVVTGQRSLSPMTGRRAALGVRWTRRLTHATVAVSEAAKHQIVIGEGLAPLRVSVIGNGVDANRFRPRDRLTARKLLGLPADTLLVGGLGRLAHSKGFEHLIEAVAEVGRELPELELALVGDGPLRPTLESLAASLGVAERVHFLGRRSDPELCYPAFDIFVLSSLREGSPNVLIEAMACGVATIATEAGGVPEIVENDETSLLLPAGDTLALTQSLKRLAANPQLRLRLGGAARSRVEADLTIERMIKKHERLYQGLLASGVKPSA